VTVGGDDMPRLWDVKTGRLLAVLEGHQGSVFGVSYCSDGKRIATASADNTVRIWDADRRTAIATLEGVAPMWDAAFSADGERLVTASEATPHTSGLFFRQRRRWSIMQRRWCRAASRKNSAGRLSSNWSRRRGASPRRSGPTTLPGRAGNQLYRGG
jgi:WD40 repeat protein